MYGQVLGTKTSWRTWSSQMRVKRRIQRSVTKICGSGGVIRQETRQQDTNMSDSYVSKKELRITVTSELDPSIVWNLRWVDQRNAYWAARVSKTSSVTWQSLADYDANQLTATKVTWLLWSSCSPWWRCQTSKSNWPKGKSHTLERRRQNAEEIQWRRTKNEPRLTNSCHGMMS